MLEKDIERHLRDGVKAMGGLCLNIRNRDDVRYSSSQQCLRRMELSSDITRINGAVRKDNADFTGRSITPDR